MQVQAAAAALQADSATRKSDGGEAEFVFDLTSAPTSPITMEILASDGEVISKSEWRDARS